MTPRRRRARLVLLATFAVFFLPVLAAWLLNVFAPEWRPFGQVNHGALVEPALRVPDEALAGVAGERVEPPHLSGKWALVYLSDGPCAAACEHALETMRRARLALGRDTPRVHRVLLLRAPSAQDAPRDRAGDLDVALAGEGWLSVLGAVAPPEGDARGAIYVVDPQGYLVMHHPGDTPVRHLHADLERMLDVSRIG